MARTLSSLPEARWPVFSGLLDELLDLHPSARIAWLAGLPPEHADLADLLRAAAGIHAEQQARPPAEAPQLPAPADDAEAETGSWGFVPGRTIGPYELIAPLGQGGMGEVWSARRSDGSVNREVALKLPHTWLLTAGARLRLRRERDFLADLSHPNIAQLYDAGIADDGQPWMALEKVDGRPIDRWCRDRRLPLAARLRLFLQVLDAVSAAHARLIVHRDLKPTNILVSDDGRVKLLDFGIAKLIDDGGRGQHTEITRIAGRSATPEYAAPEHLAGDTVTVATDIYSLGVVLHELLTGRRPPLQRRRRRGNASDDDGPPLASSATTPEFPAELGGLDERGWRRALQGDLDAVLARALAPLPAQRYASAERLADDLRRHLASEPIAARHITRLERAWKFARRHRLALASALVVSVSIVAGVGVSIWQAQRARAEAARANSTRDFLIKVLAANGRLTAGDRPAGSITAREMLDQIVDDLDGSLGAEPETRLELLSLATQLYRQWYDLKRLESSHRRYRALLAERYGPADPRIVDSLIEQASCYIEYSDFRSGLPLLDEAEARIHRQRLGGTLAEAELLTTRTLHEPADLGAATVAIDRLERAVAIYRDRDPAHRKAHWARFYLARSLAADGQNERARALALESIATERRAATRSDWFIAWQTVELGHYERALGHAAEAAAAYAEGERLVMATFGRDVDTQLEALAWRATLRAWAGDPAGALALFAAEQAVLDEAARTGERSMGEGVAWFSLAYGRLLLDLGRPAEALPLLARASAIPINTRPVQFRQADARLAHAEALAASGRHAAATAEFDAARAAYAEHGQLAVEPALLVRVRRARHLAQAGLRHQADAEFTAVLGQGGGDRALPALAEARMGLAELARADGRLATAERLAGEALRTLEPMVALQSPRLRSALLERQAALAPAGGRRAAAAEPARVVLSPAGGPLPSPGR